MNIAKLSEIGVKIEENRKKSKPPKTRTRKRYGNKVPAGQNIAVDVTPFASCPPLSPPFMTNELEQRQEWIQIPSANREIWVFSAFVDSLPGKRAVRTVRIIALSSVQTGRSSLKCYCHLWYKSSMSATQQRAKLAEIPDQKKQNSKYGVLFINCPLQSSEIPYSVTVSSEKCPQVENAIPVRTTVTTQEKKGKFTVCYEPLGDSFSDVHNLVEMIELNTILGGDKFVFYNSSIIPEVGSVLQRYESEGLVDVIQWNLPLETTQGRIQPGMDNLDYILASNECLLRYRNSQYLMFLDLDEVIVPKTHTNWDELIGEVKRLGHREGMYGFKTATFRKEWPDFSGNFVGKDKVIQYKMTSLLKLYREKEIRETQSDIKYIIDPSLVPNVGGTSMNTLPKFLVDPSLALLHRYRDLGQANDPNRLPDVSMHRFSKAIIDKVVHRWTQLNPVRSYQPKLVGFR